MYIDMSDLFERSIRKLLTIAAKRLRRHKGIKITIRKTGKRERALVIASKPKVFLQPDVVVELEQFLRGAWRA